MAGRPIVLQISLFCLKHDARPLDEVREGISSRTYGYTNSNLVTARLLACVFLALATLPSTAAAETLRGTVVSVADGDTLTLLDASKRQHKIRLSGIDAPERKQAFGTRSRQHLADLTFRKQVTADCPKKDRYGRWICKVY